MNPQDYAQDFDLEPKDMVYAGWRLIFYVDEDGKMEALWKMDGEVTLGFFIGQLETAKFSYLENAFNGEDED